MVPINETELWGKERFNALLLPLVTRQEIPEYLSTFLGISSPKPQIYYCPQLRWLTLQMRNVEEFMGNLHRN